MLRNGPNRSWTTEEVATRLGIDRDDARIALAGLCRGGLTEESADGFSYRAGAFEPIIDELVRANVENRLEVMNLMSLNALERVRSAAARAFADAFVLNRRKKNG
jgi:hypothetical protein